jgi:hypothetical protein
MASHDLASLRTLCERGVLLVKGTVAEAGPIGAVSTPTSCAPQAHAGVIVPRAGGCPGDVRQAPVGVRVRRLRRRQSRACQWSSSSAKASSLFPAWMR